MPIKDNIIYKVNLCHRWLRGFPPKECSIRIFSIFNFQYLRKQGAINLLQCCLTVKEKMDNFNNTSVDSEIRFTG